MGQHKGWIVVQDRGAWLARAWDPLVQRYGISKRFPPPHDKGEATAWVKAEAAIFIKRAREAAPQVAGWPTTEKLVADYVEFLTRRGRSPVHLNDVGVVLGRFALAIPDISRRDVLELAEKWLSSLPRAPRGKKRPGMQTPAAATGQPMSSATRNRYLATIKAMTKWGTARHLVPFDPLQAMERYAQSKPLRPQFTIDELKTLASKRTHPFFLRFAIMLWAGLRAQECHNLRWSDIDLGGRMISVSLGDYALKGNKERLVPLQRELEKILATVKHQGDGFLFPARLRKAFGSQHGRDLRRFLVDAKVDVDGRTPHKLRHCYAGLMTATGVPSILLSAYMGHESTETTEGYTEFAARYQAAVTAWPRGEFRLLASKPKAATLGKKKIA